MLPQGRNPICLSGFGHRYWRKNRVGTYIQSLTPFPDPFSMLVGSYTLRAARRSFLVENLIWNGNSMMPTVPQGSRCIADMMTYRYRDPEIGDIILFTLPESALDKGKSRQIRLSRIAARGGETVQVRNGVIFVDGEHREPAATRRLHPFFRPEVANWEASWLSYAVAEPYRVSEGYYFVLSDDRTTGDDSRYHGPVPRKNIRGRVTRVWWQPKRIHPARFQRRGQKQSRTPTYLLRGEVRARAQMNNWETSSGLRRGERVRGPAPQ